MDTILVNITSIKYFKDYIDKIDNPDKFLLVSHMSNDIFQQYSQLKDNNPDTLLNFFIDNFKKYQLFSNNFIQILS